MPTFHLPHSILKASSQTVSSSTAPGARGHVLRSVASSRWGLCFWGTALLSSSSHGGACFPCARQPSPLLRHPVGSLAQPPLCSGRVCVGFRAQPHPLCLVCVCLHTEDWIHTFLQPKETEKWGTGGENLLGAVTAFATDPGPLHQPDTWAQHRGKWHSGDSRAEHPPRPHLHFPKLGSIPEKPSTALTSFFNTASLRAKVGPRSQAVHNSPLSALERRLSKFTAMAVSSPSLCTVQFHPIFKKLFSYICFIVGEE